MLIDILKQVCSEWKMQEKTIGAGSDDVFDEAIQMVHNLEETRIVHSFSNIDYGFAPSDNPNPTNAKLSNEKLDKNIESFKPVKKKKNFKKMIGVVAVVTILSSIGIFWGTKYLIRQKEIKEIIETADAMVSDKKIEDAIIKIEEGLRKFPKADNLSDKHKEYSDALENQRIATTISEATLLSENQDYESAIIKVEESLLTYPESEELQNQLENLKKQHVSTIIFDTTTLSEEEDYESAVKKIQDGLNAYPDSEELQGKLKEYTAALQVQRKEKTLADAAKLADEGDYKSAMTVIRQAQNRYGKDEDYETVYITYLKTDGLITAEEYASAGDYKNAVTTIGNVQKSISDDMELIAVYNEYSEKYVTDVLNQAEKFVAEWDYNAAIAEVTAGLSIMFDNSDLKERLADLNAKKPVSITTLRMFDDDTWYWNEQNPVDTFGNEYTQSCNYVCFRDCFTESFVEYYVNNKYSSITGIAAPHQEIGSKDATIIQIYADDIMVYNSGWINMKTQPFRFSADISEANYVKIVVTRNDISFGINASYGLILSDIQLEPML